MKQTLAMLLALVMILGLCACGTTPVETTEPPVETTAPVEQTPAEPVLSVTEENTYTKPLGNVPEVPYWFPADLMAWEPGANPDDAYNLASIPLAQRVDKAKLTPRQRHPEQGCQGPGHLHHERQHLRQRAPRPEQPERQYVLLLAVHRHPGLLGRLQR